METQWAIMVAIALDLAIGDPRWLPHPIRWMGGFISILEKRLTLRPGSESSRKSDLKVAGIILWLIIVSGTLFLTSGVLLLAMVIDWKLGVLVNIVMIFYALAVRSLTAEGRVIKKLLKQSDLEGARKRLQTVVSRDCSREDERGVMRGVIETITENLSDGVIAPLLSAMIGGGPLALTYKAVNTLDSMVGYKNDKYKDFGWFSARADDVVNYIPARITGALIVAVAFLTKQHPLMAIKAWKKDARKGSSPNGGIPIVVFAGARDIQLGGDCFAQDGDKICIPQVGGKREDLSFDDIKWANRFVYLTAGLLVAVYLIVLILF